MVPAEDLERQVQLLLTQLEIPAEVLPHILERAQALVGGELR